MSAELLRTLLPDELLAALADTYERVVACGADAAQRLESGVRHGLDATVEAYASANWTALLPTRLLPPAALPEFSELQRSLLIVFLVIIAVNLLLIAYYWRKYGGVITDRFIRPSTLKEIEELKLSVAKLKLPFEHTPRI